MKYIYIFTCEVIGSISSSPFLAIASSFSCSGCLSEEDAVSDGICTRNLGRLLLLPVGLSILGDETLGDPGPPAPDSDGVRLEDAGVPLGGGTGDITR
jgi:hypothetical protein